MHSRIKADAEYTMHSESNILDRSKRLLLAFSVGEKGSVLVIGLMFLGIASIIGTTAYIKSSTDVMISSNYRSSERTFYDAEAGVQFALAQIQNGLKNGSLAIGPGVSLSSFTVPTNFSFTLSTLTQPAANVYQFDVTSAANNSNAFITVTFKRQAAISYAAFGDTMVDSKAFSKVYSYDSSHPDFTDPTHLPTPSDTTHEGDVGSNGEVSVKMGTVIDGDVVLGNNGTNDATYTAEGSPNVYGEEGVTVGPIDSDPLGIIGGEYATKFATYVSSNNNASASIAGTTLSLGNGDHVTLQAGNYYLTSLTLNNGATLDVDTSGGDVNIWLAGPMEAKNGSQINVSGKPTNFSIFSNSTSSLVIKHDGDFKGLVYAPYAAVEMKNSANVYGAVWADTVDGKNSSELYYDTALKNKYQSSNLSLTSWFDNHLRPVN